MCSFLIDNILTIPSSNMCHRPLKNKHGLCMSYPSCCQSWAFPECQNLRIDLLGPHTDGIKQMM